MLSGSLAFAVLDVRTFGVLLRFYAPGDQSGTGLRHHDQHLRVRKGLLPEDEPGARVSLYVRS